MLGLEAAPPAHCGRKCAQRGQGKIRQVPAAVAIEVSVQRAPRAQLEPCALFAQVHALEHAPVNQQVQSAVDGGPRDAPALARQREPELFGSEAAPKALHPIQDQLPLAGAPRPRADFFFIET